MSEREAVTIRHGLKPGDQGMIIHLHGAIYAAEYGLDATFEPYVARPLADFALAGPDAGRIWLAETAGPGGEARILGCIAVVKVDQGAGQIRWFLLRPEARGKGLGRLLLEAALAYARDEGLSALHLWTFADLDAAIHLYRAYGFALTEEATHAIWGGIRTEQRFDLRLT